MPTYRIVVKQESQTYDIEAPSEEVAVEEALNRAYDFYTTSTTDVKVFVERIEQL